ncbi:MAG: methylenetetrahydrofolate reductase C-terminal domain-containing protein [Actinobacteria bacterium]|nr:methylenetetrahydrofolate reductase C-terminal domain-containing protein [Actinomycetota bacterium]MCG2808074.1 methylenetetrahydrofolate reductase C-terminal domain-containing protein [Coriobacteriia bacterium]
MIVVRQKPLDEICAMIAGHRRVLLVGCNTCAAVSLAGGETEVDTLLQLLRLTNKRHGTFCELTPAVLQRQCEPEYIDCLQEGDYDAVLSLGCGAGVALLASTVGKPVYPALDTLFIGSAKGLARWQAECSACGQCVLGMTAGICPITRCAKGILNGPCGGVSDGTCELGDRPCAWVEIYERLDSLGCAENFDTILAPKDNTTRQICEWDMSEGCDEK